MKYARGHTCRAGGCAFEIQCRSSEDDTIAAGGHRIHSGTVKKMWIIEDDTPSGQVVKVKHQAHCYIRKRKTMDRGQISICFVGTKNST